MKAWLFGLALLCGTAISLVSLAGCVYLEVLGWGRGTGLGVLSLITTIATVLVGGCVICDSGFYKR